MSNITIPKKNYVFGYGSIINILSAMKTGKVKLVSYGEADGLIRNWNNNEPFLDNPDIPDDEKIMTTVGALPYNKGKTNGVLIEVPDEAIEKFAEREERYNLNHLRKKDIKLFDAQTPEGHHHFYEIKEPSEPNDKFPLAQSYIDVILAGCLEYDKKHSTNFTEQFIKTTGNWEKGPWINDREKPRYPRALGEDEMTPGLYDTIDQKLIENVPEAFKKRIELSRNDQYRNK